MKTKINIDVKAGVIYTVAQGEIGFSDLRAQRELILSHPDYSPEFDHIFDGRSACLRFTGNESHMLAAWSASPHFPDETRISWSDRTFPYIITAS